jgi:hypothetical protein
VSDLDALERRMAAVEEKLKGPLPKPRKDFWEKAQSIGGALASVVVAIIGVTVAYGINRVIEQQKIDFGYAKELRELLGNWPGTANEDQARASALAIASLGPPSIHPLLARMEGGGDVTEGAVRQALGTLAVRAPLEVCGAFGEVLDNPGRFFNWYTHDRIIAWIGDFQCHEQRPILERYRRLLERAKQGDLAAYAARVNDRLMIDAASITTLLETLDATDAVLDRGAVQ